MPFTKAAHGQDLEQQPIGINGELISPAASTLDFMHLPDQADKSADSACMYGVHGSGAVYLHGSTASVS
jgi:hypothetical protein